MRGERSPSRLLAAPCDLWPSLVPSHGEALAAAAAFGSAQEQQLRPLRRSAPGLPSRLCLLLSCADYSAGASHWLTQHGANFLAFACASCTHPSGDTGDAGLKFSGVIQSLAAAIGNLVLGVWLHGCDDATTQGMRGATGDDVGLRPRRRGEVRCTLLGTNPSPLASRPPPPGKRWCHGPAVSR